MAETMPDEVLTKEVTSCQVTKPGDCIDTCQEAQPSADSCQQTQPSDACTLQRTACASQQPTPSDDNIHDSELSLTSSSHKCVRQKPIADTSEILSGSDTKVVVDSILVATDQPERSASLVVEVSRNQNFQVKDRSESEVKRLSIVNTDANKDKESEVFLQHLPNRDGCLKKELISDEGTSNSKGVVHLRRLDYLDYAEVLYKCSLCATMPAILTSREHFSSHVREVHLEASGNKCPDCELHFDVLEDVRRHQNLSHLGPFSNMAAPYATDSPTCRTIVPSVFPNPQQITEQVKCGSNPTSVQNLSVNHQPVKGVDQGEELDSVRNSPGNSSKDDDTDTAVPCRSRRKRAFPRHLEMEEQVKSCPSTESTSVCYSEESHSSDRVGGVPHTDYSLLQSDRKRLMLWSPRTKVVSGDEQRQHSQDSSSPRNMEDNYKPKATICYKPAKPVDVNGCSYAALPGKQNSPNIIRNNTVSAAPLDLVLQDRSSCSGLKQSSEVKPKSPIATPEDLSDFNPPEHKKKRLVKDTTLFTGDCSYPLASDYSRMGMPYPAQYEAMYAWSLGFYNLSRQQGIQSIPQQHAAGCRPSSNDSMKPGQFTEVKAEGFVDTEKTNPSCAQCKMDFVSAEQFCQHYREVHLTGTSPTSGHAASAGDQQFRVLWLKQHLTKYVLPSSGGVVLRDDVLDLMMDSGVDTSDAATWGPACNRAVREVYPDSQAHRKGKFKKTYFFGVRLVGSFPSSACPDVEEDTCQVLQQEDEEGSEDDDEESDILDEERAGGKVNIQDLEKLTAHLPCVIRWTGHMDACITRDSLLQAMARRLDENNIITWGIQCNRAVRQLFPEVSIKRKGKYKSTCYYGIEMISRGVGRHAQVSTWSRSTSGSGPPVVNVRDILETPGHSSMSRLPRPGQQVAGPGTKSPHSESSNPTNHLQAILHMLPTGCQSGPGGGTPGIVRTNDGVFIARWGCDPRGMPARGLQSPVNHSRGSSPASDHSDVRNKMDSPQRSPLALTTHQAKQDDVTLSNHSNHRPLMTSPSPAHTAVPTSGPVDALEKLVLLHPGPFVTARIFSRRFQRLSPGLEKVLYAMEMLQGRGLGQVCTLQHGGSKVFFKSIPSMSLEVPLNVLGIRMVDYQVMFYERDQKLEDTLHERLKAYHPQPDLLAAHYRH